MRHREEMTKSLDYAYKKLATSKTKKIQDYSVDLQSISRIHKRTQGNKHMLVFLIQTIFMFRRLQDCKLTHQLYQFIAIP